MQISEQQLREIRDRADIVQVIGESVALKRVGSSFRGLCPFHSEKSPSFYVHPDRQFFHCFGCQTSGDAIAFVMKLDGKTFTDAVRALADRVGIKLELSESAGDPRIKQAQQHQQRLYALVDAAAGFYLAQLERHEHAHLARAELEKRKITLPTRQAYRLGYAPSSWDGLSKYLESQGFSPREGEDAGLLLPRRTGSGHYDRFRHRLMFPISDVQGRVIAFSGRILAHPETGEISKEEGKYVNSPETTLYKKGELLFGLHEARVALRREDRAFLCEGNFDVLALHQAGIVNVVAPLGTAFTPQQANLLRRYVTRVTVIFDADNAGQKATRAAFPLLQGANLTASVATLPKGEDPDSFLRGSGAEALQKRCAEARPILEHLIFASADQAGSDPGERAKAIELLGPILLHVKNPVELGLYVEKIGQIFGVADLGAVRQQLRRGVESERRGQRNVRGRTEASSDGGGPAATPSSAGDVEAPKLALPPLEKDIVGTLLDCPSLVHEEQLLASGPYFQCRELWALVRAIENILANAPPETTRVNGAEVLEYAAKPLHAWLAERLSTTTFDSPKAAEAFLGSALKLLRQHYVEREQKRLLRAIADARRHGNIDEAEALERERNEIFRSAR